MNIDEIIAVLTAFKEGKNIELDVNQNWFGIDKGYDKWDFINNTYRIAPQPKLIPFDYNDDLVGKVVKIKNLKTLITSQSLSNVFFNEGYTSYKNLLNDFKFLDDKPCGKYE